MTISRRWNWPLCAAVVWVGLCLAVAISAYITPTAHTVFDIYAIASQAWWAGDDMFIRQQETHELYRYSPAFAVLVSPFAALPPGCGNALWKLANAGIFLGGLWVWCRRGLPGPLTRDQIAAVFLFAVPAASGSLYIGQANLMMTGLVLLGLTAVAEERWWWAAGYLAAATLFKVFPLALAMVVAVLFWRTFPLRFLVALGIGLAIPFAAQWPEYVCDQTLRWFQHVTASVELNRERLRSLEKMLELSGAPVKPKQFLLLGVVAGAEVLAATLLARWQGVERREVLLRLLAWFLAWVVLFSPSTENATYGILAPVMAWALVDAFGQPGTWLRRIWLLAALYLMGLSGGDAGIPLKQCFGQFCWTTLGGVMFQMILIVDLFKSRPPRF